MLVFIYKISVNDGITSTKEEKAEPEQPKMTRLASKYPKLFKVNKELEDQNGAIQQKQKQLSAKKKELSEVKGWFKGRKKKEFLEKHSIHNRVKLKMIESINKRNIELKELSK